MNQNNTIVSAFNVPMPKIIYGTAWKKAQTASLVEQAITLGFRGIDTACQPKHYYEPGVGAGIASCLDRGLLQRRELYLQSKFTSLSGQDPLQIPYDAKASLTEQVHESFQVSLRNLRTPYLDCLVLHSPMATPWQTLEVWRAMEQLFQTGEVKQLGLSNCYDLEQFKTLYDSALIKPAVLQNRFYAATGYDRELRDFCQQQQVIYQSFWSLTANPAILADAKFKKLATKMDCSPAQLFLRYLTQVGIMPLTGTTSTVHMQADLAIFEFTLSASECELVTGLLGLYREG